MILSGRYGDLYWRAGDRCRIRESWHVWFHPLDLLCRSDFYPSLTRSEPAWPVNTDIGSSAHEQYVIRCPVAGFVRRRLA